MVAHDAPSRAVIDGRNLDEPAFIRTLGIEYVRIVGRAYVGQLRYGSQVAVIFSDRSEVAGVERQQFNVAHMIGNNSDGDVATVLPGPGNLDAQALQFI